MGLLGSWKSDDKDRVRLHGGKLVLYRRPEYASARWQYRLALPSGGYERHSTDQADLEAARRVAEERWKEVQWRSARRLSEREVPFEVAAREYAEHLRLEARAQGLARVELAERKAGLIERYLIPHFKGRPLGGITAQDVTRFHDWYLRNWEERRAGGRLVLRRRDRLRRAYPTPLAVPMPFGFVRRPGVNSRRAFEQILRGVFDLAARSGRITAAERPALPATRAERHRRGAFTPEEQARLLAHLEARIGATPARHFRHARRMLWLFVRLNLLVGTRPGKESDLRFRDVEFRGGGAHPHALVRVRAGKTGARTVVAPAEAWEVVELVREQHPCPALDAKLWVTLAGAEVTTFRESFMAALRELGFLLDAEGNRRSLYSLRHSGRGRGHGSRAHLGPGHPDRTRRAAGERLAGPAPARVRRVRCSVSGWAPARFLVADAHHWEGRRHPRADRRRGHESGRSGGPAGCPNRGVPRGPGRPGSSRLVCSRCGEAVRGAGRARLIRRLRRLGRYHTALPADAPAS